MASSGSKRQLIMVDGRSGAGKTEFALTLHNQLGCPLVSLDDIYPGWDGLDAGAHHVFHHGIIPWSRGEIGVLRLWDWNRGAPGGVRECDPGDSLIIEGCGAISRFAAPYATRSYWVEADDDIRKTRALQRDGDVFALHWQRWALQEERFYSIHRSRDLAHEVIET